MSDEELTEFAEDIAEDGEWRVGTEKWDGTEYSVIHGAQGEVVVTEPIEFHAYASGAFITPARMEFTLEAIAKAHNALPGLVKELLEIKAFMRERARMHGVTLGHGDFVQMCTVCDADDRGRPHRTWCPLAVRS